MPRPLMQEPAPQTSIPGARRRRYLVMCRQNLWFIAFEREEFGPYQSEREAMLFAVDAAPASRARRRRSLRSTRRGRRPRCGPMGSIPIRRH